LAWRHIGFEDLLRIVVANGVGAAVLALVVRFTIGPAFPRSVYILDPLLCVTLDAATRAGIRILFEATRQAAKPGIRRVLIYGAGRAGMTLFNELRRQSEPACQVVGFLDDDPAKRDMRVHGMRVFGGRRELAQAAGKLRVDEILIALPTASGSDITEILEQCYLAQVAAKRVPALSEILDHKVLADQIREVRIEDLLGRPPARLDATDVREQLTGQVVLVTGAGGSIGSELCRQIARLEPAAIVGFDQAETALYEIEHELRAAFPQVAFHPEIGSVQNRQRLEELFATYRPSSVYHAAAYKHVPMMEAHMFEAIKNNIFGTRNVARAAASWGARELVMVSTDKAVRPTNVMGATKRVAELVCMSEAQRPARLRGTATKAVAVRFGNVLGSNGSVIPRFRQQIARGGPVTVTHPEMRRFFMTIPEAAQLVLEAGAMGAGGEIFVLEMGEPVRILDLARKLILLSGLRPETDIPIAFSGLRPGEKMYEELSAYEENTVATPHKQIRVFAGLPMERASIERALEQLRGAVRARDAAGAIMTLKEMVPDYNPSTSVLRTVLREKAQSFVA
jgi:FlaA1/EpsC-like NDP-sugar epimerase